MKLELKKLKINKRASEETLAFNADLWIDGKFAARVSNDGRGGANRTYFEDRALEKAAAEYCASLPPVKGEYGDLKMDLDFALSILADGGSL